MTHFDLVDVIQQVVAFLHLVSEELAVNKKDVGQILCPMNVAKCFPCIHGPFVTFGVSNLVVSQVEADHRHGIFDTLLVLF